MGLFVLGACGLNFLYGRGGFSEGATHQTLLCLWGYALGLLPAVFTLLFASAFYALKDYRTPMKGCFLSVGVNCALNALFVFAFGFGAFSIALSTSLSALCNTLYLFSQLKKRSGVTFCDTTMQRTFFKVGTITLLSTLVVLFVGHVTSLDPTLSILLKGEISFSRHFSQQLFELITLGATFLTTFFTAAWLLKCDDVLFFFKKEGFSRAGSAREDN